MANRFDSRISNATLPPPSSMYIDCSLILYVEILNKMSLEKDHADKYSISILKDPFNFNIVPIPMPRKSKPISVAPGEQMGWFILSGSLFPQTIKKWFEYINYCHF